MKYQYIVANAHDGWAEIILNRPEKMNALRPEMCLEIATAAENLAADADIKCVVFRAAGKHFSAGYDVATETDISSTKRQWIDARAVQDAFTRINRLPVATVCELKGYVVGAGLLLAAVCNLRYATPDAVFYVPELDMGIPFSLGGVATLARYVGITRAAEMVLNCVKVRADDPCMSSFVTRIRPVNELAATVEQVAKAIAARPNSLVLASVTTLREAEQALMPAPASDLFTMLFVDREAEAKAVRTRYSERFKGAGK